MLSFSTVSFLIRAASWLPFPVRSLSFSWNDVDASASRSFVAAKRLSSSVCVDLVENGIFYFEVLQASLERGDIAVEKEFFVHIDRLRKSDSLRVRQRFSSQ